MDLASAGYGRKPEWVRSTLSALDGVPLVGGVLEYPRSTRPNTLQTQQCSAPFLLLPPLHGRTALGSIPGSIDSSKPSGKRRGRRKPGQEVTPPV